jgi:glycosyltransferase involved in cell wall biosynthesis
MINIGYFSHTTIGPSETFILDLIQGLNQNKNLNISYISGSNNPSTTLKDIKYLQTGFADNYAYFANLIYKVGDLKGKNGNKLKLKFQKWVAYRTMQNIKINEIDIAYIDYATSAVLLFDYLIKQGIPFIVHVHGYDITTTLNNDYFRQLLSRVFSNAKCIIAASHYMKRRLILLGCPEEKIRVIRYGVDNKRITPIPWEDRKLLNPSIIFLGRLTEKKNPLALLHALKIVKISIPNILLTIIGDGELKEITVQTIRQLGLVNNVKMMGLLTREDSFPIINKHWVYAQHSVTGTDGNTEGFAISLAEAALHELPVVSTVHNGITENVIDGKTGFLVPEYDFEEMALKLIFLLKNPSVAEKMGIEGRKHITNLCDPQKRIHEINKIIESIVENKN